MTHDKARDKAKDDKFFNCDQDYEVELVANHYGSNKQVVINFLKESCHNGKIHYSTHLQVYTLIKNELGYPIPV